MGIKALVKPVAVGLGLTAYLSGRLKKNRESHNTSPWGCFAPVCRPGPRME
jgi:hypothetical protein